MASSNLAAAKRLRKELSNLQRSSSKKKGGSNAIGGSSTSDPDIYLIPDSENILHWTALLRGPDDTPYQGGIFQLDIRCGTDYPLAPPTIEFVTKIFHPNVHFKTGEICLDILKKEWSPAWGIQASCRAILALLSDPDASSPLNCDAGNMLRGGDIYAYYTTAHMYTIENATFLSWPGGSMDTTDNDNGDETTTKPKSKIPLSKMEAAASTASSPSSVNQ